MAITTYKFKSDMMALSSENLGKLTLASKLLPGVAFGTFDPADSNAQTIFIPVSQLVRAGWDSAEVASVQVTQQANGIVVITATSLDGQSTITMPLVGSDALLTIYMGQGGTELAQLGEYNPHTNAGQRITIPVTAYRTATSHAPSIPGSILIVDDNGKCSLSFIDQNGTSTAINTGGTRYISATSGAAMSDDNFAIISNAVTHGESVVLVTQVGGNASFYYYSSASTAGRVFVRPAADALYTITVANTSPHTLTFTAQSLQTALTAGSFIDMTGDIVSVSPTAALGVEAPLALTAGSGTATLSIDKSGLGASAAPIAVSVSDDYTDIVDYDEATLGAHGTQGSVMMLGLKLPAGTYNYNIVDTINGCSDGTLTITSASTYYLLASFGYSDISGVVWRADAYVYNASRRWHIIIFGNGTSVGGIIR